MKRLSDLDRLRVIGARLDRDGLPGNLADSEAVLAAVDELVVARAPVPLLLWCPECSARHIDEGEFATKVHHTHACQTCGHVWRPAIVATVGVRFLPGFKDAPEVSR